MEVLKSMGQRIRALRIKSNMTQDDLARKLGYTSRSTINKIELGKNDLHQTKIMAFAKALNTTPSYLLGFDEDLEVKKNILTIDFINSKKLTHVLTDEELKSILKIIKKEK